MDLGESLHGQRQVALPEPVKENFNKKARIYYIIFRISAKNFELPISSARLKNELKTYQ